MKKLFVLLCLVAVTLVGCQESPFSDESKAYSGKYEGTFTLLKQNTDSTPSEAKPKKIIFTQNPLNMDNLLLEGVFEMARAKEGVYEFHPNELSATLLESAVSFFKLDEYLGGSIEKINDISATATFSGNTVSLKFYYNVTIVGVDATVVVATFEGTKAE